MTSASATTSTASLEAALGQAKLPVLHALSSASLNGLQAYIEAGNARHRLKQWVDWFKTIDWMSFNDLDTRLLSRLPIKLRQQVKADVRAYYRQKAEGRQARQTQQAEYRQRVDAYYRETLCSGDKALLESLRDYELELTGRDANWQHHFRFKSFKKIDEFVAAGSLERQKLIQAFQQDVLTYKKNKETWEKTGLPPYMAGEAGPADFDSWAESIPVNPSPGGAKQTRQAQPPPASELPPKVRLAYERLRLPPSASWTQVKKQFRKLTLSAHPDRPGGSETKMRQLLEAYNYLEKHFQ